MRRISTSFFTGPLIAALLAGCALLPEKIDETRGWSAQRLYSEARTARDEGNYKTALDYLDKIQARYTRSRRAIRSAATPSKRSSTPFSSNTATTNRTPLSRPPTVSSRPTRVILMSIMLITSKAW